MGEDAELAADSTIKTSLDRVRHEKGGKEYWLAREIASILGYPRWQRFMPSLQKARQACSSIGSDPRYHFIDIRKTLASGNNAEREIDDVVLSRYGCYLAAMNGDPRKPEIASAQIYFAVQTRKQELTEQGQAEDLDAARIATRERIKDHHKGLSSAAKNVGVHNYGLFIDAGIRGLYGDLGLADVRQKKGLGPKEDIYDRAGHEELAANEFRITQTSAKLKRLKSDNISDEIIARRTHNTVGRDVRDTIRKIGGTMPEELPPEESIKKLVRRKKKKLPPTTGGSA